MLVPVHAAMLILCECVSFYSEVVFCGKLKEILRLLRDRRVIVSVLLYSLGGFVQVMLTEVCAS